MGMKKKRFLPISNGSALRQRIFYRMDASLDDLKDLMILEQ